nr:right-handed parallel beta-helix repeat-containing protein [Desulfobulbaceae bacterium]
MPYLFIVSIFYLPTFFPHDCLAGDNAYSLEDSIVSALAAADDIAKPLLNVSFHNGRQLVVPDQFTSIQDALDAANSGDTVIVKPGTYYERLFVRDGIKLTSFEGDAGNSLQAVDGAMTMLPRRTGRTIIDGAKDQSSPVAMLTFSTGASRNTIVDGFTIQNLPNENHHNPGHSHAVNLRGASPVIMNCYVVNNGSTGIGNHVTYLDQDKVLGERDFRFQNVEHATGAVIYRNIVAYNLGRGIGCNHFATSFLLGNEVYGNDDSSLTESPGPGIGVKHGAAPNIVHDNPYGGIKGKQGVNQGKFPVDYPPRPIIRSNVVFRNGKQQPNIACSSCGTDELPVIIANNFIFDTGAVGINLGNGSIGVIANNIVTSGQSKGIVVRNSRVSKLVGNVVLGAKDTAFFISDDSEIALAEKNRPTPQFKNR